MKVKKILELKWTDVCEDSRDHFSELCGFSNDSYIDVYVDFDIPSLNFSDSDFKDHLSEVYNVPVESIGDDIELFLREQCMSSATVYNLYKQLKGPLNLDGIEGIYLDICW